MKNAPLHSMQSNPPADAEDVAASVDRLSRRGTPVPDRYAPGSIFAGKYRIVGLLGEGGMGAVWRAHSLSLDVDVAIKVLHREQIPSLASARLLREARATASIGHPAIVQIFDFGETEAGEPFLIMELLEGESLAGWLDERGRISATLAVQMLLPIASALVAAHARGIIHRDIKPENIIAVPSGLGTYLPKIVDFGVAKLLSSHHGARVLTEAGVILGSLEYMSPEQAEGQQEVGEQTDIWALCVVLYELISGQRPFHGATATATIFALYTRDPTPTTQLAAGDEELWAILRRGLEKSPTKRWSTMQALGRALAFWATERGITVDTAGTSLAHHWGVSESDSPVSSSPSAPVSRASTMIALPSPRAMSFDFPSHDAAEPSPQRAHLPHLPRLGTIELSHPALERRSSAPVPAPRPRAVLPSLVVALALVSIAAVAGLSRFASREAPPGGEAGTAPQRPDPAGSALALIAAASALPPGPEPAPSAAGSVAQRDPKAEGSAVIIKARDASAPPGTAMKPKKTAMPLPPTPNY
jgi:serine/threonine-protein kinase